LSRFLRLKDFLFGGNVLHLCFSSRMHISDISPPVRTAACLVYTARTLTVCYFTTRNVFRLCGRKERGCSFENVEEPETRDRSLKCEQRDRSRVENLRAWTSVPVYIPTVCQFVWQDPEFVSWYTVTPRLKTHCYPPPPAVQNHRPSCHDVIFLSYVVSITDCQFSWTSRRTASTVYSTVLNLRHLLVIRASHHGCRPFR